MDNFIYFIFKKRNFVETGIKKILISESIKLWYNLNDSLIKIFLKSVPTNFFFSFLMEVVHVENYLHK